MALTLHLAAFAGFVVSGFATDAVRARPAAPSPIALGAVELFSAHVRPPVATCRWQRDVATGRLSAHWQT